MRYLFPVLLSLSVSLTPAFCLADPPQVLAAKVNRSGMFWRIDVTLKHPDTGWDHYADLWQVTDAKGNVLAKRKLLHPHVDEQPFTRSLTNVNIPDGTSEVFISAKCSKGDWGADKFRVPIGN